MKKKNLRKIKPVSVAKVGCWHNKVWSMTENLCQRDIFSADDKKKLIIVHAKLKAQKSEKGNSVSVWDTRPEEAACGRNAVVEQVTSLDAGNVRWPALRNASINALVLASVCHKKLLQVQKGIAATLEEARNSLGLSFVVRIERKALVRQTWISCRLKHNVFWSRWTKACDGVSRS